MLLVRLPGQKALLRECQPQKSGRGLPGPPLHSAGRTAGLSFFKGNGKPRLHRGRGYPQNLSAGGFSNFKIEGRGLGSALILEFLLYYMTKPEYQLRVREEIYLDNMLDLF